MNTPLIEAIARALHDGDHPDDIMEWPEHSDSWRANYARSAQAALTAITEAGYQLTRVLDEDESQRIMAQSVVDYQASMAISAAQGDG